MNYSLINNDIGAPGIFRAKLIPPTVDDFVRVYIPGISNMNPFKTNGDVNETIVKQHINNFPTVQWCCYNIDSTQLENQDSFVWVMFESGDFKRPVVISYAVIGGLDSGTTGTYNDGYTTYDTSNINFEDGEIFELTGYCPCEKCCGKWANGITSTGVTAIAGRTIAVDPKVIPYGTEVEIEDLGTRIAEDCGGAIKGKRIDVYFNTHQEALNFGRKSKRIVIKKK